MNTTYQGLHQIARQANWLESIGNIYSSYRMRKLLENHNCCPGCGTIRVSAGLRLPLLCPVCGREGLGGMSW